MANPSSPRRAPRNAPQPKVHRYVDALFIDDFGRAAKLTVQSAHAFARKKLDAASQALQLKTESAERKAVRASDRDYRRAERALEAELREADHRWRKLFRRIRTAVRPDKAIRHSPPKQRKRLWPYAAVALPAYDGPILDRRGERGVFARFRYYSRRTARAGVSARVVAYVFNGAALDATGSPYSHSNIGREINEASCGFDHLEQVNWAAAKNAKLLMHGILAMDCRQTPDEMMDCAVRWAEETLGRFDLPYLVTLHAPPEDGDQRNWHAHVLWSFRPMVRTGDHEWLVGEMLRTDLDNPQAMKLMREMFAAVMTDVSFEAGQKQVWTAKSNTARGIVEEPQKHIGAALTNRARQGEFVAANEENHERVMRSKVARVDEELRHTDEALAQRQAVDRAMLGSMARPPVLVGRVPERIAVATIATGLARVRDPRPRIPADDVVPALASPLWREPARPMSEITAIATPPARIVDEGLSHPQAVPAERSHPIPLPKIVNLRFSVVPPISPSVPISATAPGERSRIAGVRPLPDLKIDVVTQVRTEYGSILLPLVARAKPPSLSLAALVTKPVARISYSGTDLCLPARQIVSPIRLFGPVAAPLPQLSFDIFDRALEHQADARLREEQEHESERVAAEAVRKRTADAAEAAESHRAALRRLFEAIRRERHYLAPKDGRHIVPPSLLVRFGVAPEALADTEVKKELAEIAIMQAAEISRIAQHVRRAPQELRRQGESWSPAEETPAEVRRLIEAWAHDPALRAAFERFAPNAPAPSTTPVVDQDRPAGEQGSDWHRARHLRKRAMADWAETERPDLSRVSQPGRILPQPGKDRGDAETPQPGIARRVPSLPGSGIGD